MMTLVLYLPRIYRERWRLASRIDDAEAATAFARAFAPPGKGRLRIAWRNLPLVLTADWRGASIAWFSFKAKDWIIRSLGAPMLGAPQHPKVDAL